VNKYRFEEVNGGRGYDIIDWFKNKVCWCLHLHDAQSCVDLLNKQSSHLRLFAATHIEYQEVQSFVWVEAEDESIARSLFDSSDYDRKEAEEVVNVQTSEIRNVEEVTK